MELYVVYWDFWFLILKVILKVNLHIFCFILNYVHMYTPGMARQIKEGYVQWYKSKLIIALKNRTLRNPAYF